MQRFIVPILLKERKDTIKRLITRLEFVKVVSITVLLDKANNVSRDEYFVRKRDKANTYVIQYAT